ncbi:MAG: cache domain-containing protein [Thermodesulfobacteriota bacterium]
MAEKPSISTTLLRNMILLALVALTAWSTLWALGEYRSYLTDSQDLREQLIQAQKDLLESQMDQVMTLVASKEKETEGLLKESIRQKVYEACAVAENVYKENQGKRADSEIVKMITDALRPIRFNQGRGYFFAFDLSGVERLFADRPEMEGKNMLDLADPQGNFVVRDMIAIAEKQGEGFYPYRWTRPGKEGWNHAKIAFVRLFAPLSLVIGSGEYVDDVSARVRDEAVARLVSLRYGKEGYFFASTIEGDTLFSNGRITKGAGNLWDLTDPNGVKIFQEQLRAASYPGGGFIRYSWPKIGSDVPIPKLAYVRGFPAWGWIIGTGTYLDSVDHVLDARKRALRRDLISGLAKSAGLLLLLVLAIILWARLISAKMKASISAFSSFFRKAATESVVIDPQKQHFSEFVDLAVSANRMLTDRLSAEKSLRESRERLAKSEEALLEAQHLAGVGNWSWEAGPDVLFWSREIFRICGLEGGVSGPDLEIFKKTVHPEDLSKLQDVFLRALQAREEYALIHRILRPDGTARCVEHKGRFLFGPDGELIRVWGTVQDITEKKDLERERRELDERLSQVKKMEAMGTLAGGIAHDFNNILGIILGNTELAMDDLPEESLVRESLREVRTASLRARDVVRELLRFSRKSEQVKKIVHLDELVAESLDAIRPHLPQGVRPVFEPFSSCPVMADESQIRQVLANLLSNAAEAMEKSGGTLRVAACMREIGPEEAESLRLVSPGSYASLSVEDTGEGISPENWDRIFDPYFTTRVPGQGRGLGLAVAHGIVTAHHGAITVKSEPGKGTVFTAVFPALTK